MGYAGGATDAPTYQAIGDHVECVEVLYDPATVTYEELLDVFWASHDPAARPYTNQYRSLVLATTTEQLATARESAARFSETSGSKVATKMERLSEFYPAEDYHQKYYLRQEPVLARDFKAMFGSDEAAFRDSAAAAKVNGYLVGDGAPEQLASQIGALGLSREAATYLTQRVADDAATAGCAIDLQ